MKTLAIFAYAILLPFLTYHPHHPSYDQGSSDDEVYEVYSTAIKELYLNKGEWVKSGSTDSGVEQLVVIRDQTTPYGAPGPDNVSAWRTGGISIDDETIKDFERENKGPISLEPRFTFPAKQVLISDLTFKRQMGTGGWPGFYKRYPKSAGYIELSRVGFNRDHSQALQYIARTCGGLCGEGYYVILGKEGLVRQTEIFVVGLII